MEFFKKAFEANTDDNPPEPAVNTELDEDPLPEGVDMPSTESMLDVIAQVEESPTTPRPSASRPTEPRSPFDDMFDEPGSQQSVYDDPADVDDLPADPSDSPPQSSGNIGLGLGQMKDIDPDVVSVTTDVNRHGRELDNLSSQVRLILSKMELIPTLDSSIRSLNALVNELRTSVTAQEKQLKDAVNKSDSYKTDITALSHRVTGLTRAFNKYQTDTASAIANVERRAATNQLRAEPEPNVDLIPPEEVSSANLAPVQPERERVPEKSVTVDLSGWM